VIRKVEMERFTVISARPFDEIVAAIKASIGNPNMAEFVKSTQEAKSATDLEVAIQPALGRTGLMLFVEFDQGMILRKGTDRHGSRMIRLVVGNPLIMKEMAKHVPDAGSYAPVPARLHVSACVHISRRAAQGAEFQLPAVAYNLPRISGTVSKPGDSGRRPCARDGGCCLPEVRRTRRHGFRKP